jgi:long-chain acyl-CoA synthetase
MRSHTLTVCPFSFCVFRYYKNKEATDEVITTCPDGLHRMFHTGDLGRFVEDGFIKVTGRVKELYKLENGKYVCPTPIEEAIGMSRYISQVVLCGANRPYNTVLIVPEWVNIRKAVGATDSVSDDELANDPRVKELIDSEIASSCSRIKKFEIPRAWAFVAPFTAANNMLTPKMSIRRHKVVQTYADLVNHMYGDPIVAPSADASHSEKQAA